MKVKQKMEGGERVQPREGGAEGGLEPGQRWELELEQL